MNTNQLPEVFLSDSTISYKVMRLAKQGKVKRLVGKLYTSNLVDSVDNIVHRRLWEIIGLLFPKAIIADKTAWTLSPNEHNEIFVISDKTRPVTIGTYTIYPRKGVSAQKTDTPFMENLYLPSTARKFLESVRIARRVKSVENRYLNQAELEERIDAYIRSNQESGMNKLRDKMKELAPVLGLEDEYNKINAIIGTLLHTHESKLVTSIGQSRKLGDAFDPQREVLFTLLYEELSNRAPVFRKFSNNDSTVLCFYEAYFSNYIEGTKFPVEDAIKIVFKNQIPENRPADAHDISETYNVLASMQEMRKTPRNFEELIDLLKSRHQKIMAGRSEKHPGKFKTQRNQAGSTVFVEPDLIVGTLRKGFELYQKLNNALSRAIFMMFMISEVHPFDDGNGRLSRIMMNSELVASDEQRIIIPTVYRGNYLMALKALSHNKFTDSFVKTIDFAQKYTHSIDWTDLKKAGDMLKATNAFVENSEDETAILKLPKNIL